MLGNILHFYGYFNPMGLVPRRSSDSLLGLQLFGFLYEQQSGTFRRGSEVSQGAVPEQEGSHVLVPLAWHFSR